MTLTNFVPANHSVHFALEFPTDDTIHCMFQELFLQFLLILGRPRPQRRSAKLFVRVSHNSGGNTVNRLYKMSEASKLSSLPPPRAARTTIVASLAVTCKSLSKYPCPDQSAHGI